MSDNEDNKPEGEQEPEEPRTFLKQEQIIESLSLIQRTAGTYFLESYPFCRWTLLRLLDIEFRGEGNPGTRRPSETVHPPSKPQHQQKRHPRRLHDR